MAEIRPPGRENPRRSLAGVVQRTAASRPRPIPRHWRAASTTAIQRQNQVGGTAAASQHAAKLGRVAVPERFGENQTGSCLLGLLLSQRGLGGWARVSRRRGPDVAPVDNFWLVLRKAAD
jgi:hypothetical protein